MSRSGGADAQLLKYCGGLNSLLLVAECQSEALIIIRPALGPGGGGAPVVAFEFKPVWYRKEPNVIGRRVLAKTLEPNAQSDSGTSYLSSISN